MLLTLPDWERVIDRPVPEPVAAPIVGVDLGGNRAWSAAVAIWETGRVEAVAVHARGAGTLRSRSGATGSPAEPTAGS